MIQIPLKRKYCPPGSNKAKRNKSRHNDGARKRIPGRSQPAPVSRVRTMVLIEGRKIGWEG